MDHYKSPFNSTLYLERINCSSSPAPSFEFLKDIHYAQLYTIPFENFDICLNRGINLEPTAIFDKLVRKARGGYCFELNGLFLMALKSFGFDARALLGRVHITGVPTGRGHQVSLVTIDENQWILDVGFGAETPQVPIPLRFNQPITSERQKLRLVESERFGIMLQSEQNGDWGNLYSFDLSYVCSGDIKYGNHFASTHPESLFVGARVAVLPTVDGVMTLFNRTLKKRITGTVEAEELEEGQVYIDALRTIFGIELEAAYDDLKPISNL